MKVQAGRADAFLARIDPALKVLLFFGPDTGLVRERADKVVAALAGSPPDPFGYAELTMGDLSVSPSRLSDEMRTVGFGSARRVVFLRDATDAVGATVSDVLSDTVSEGLLILTAGELTARSALRKAVEGSQLGAAIGCYGDSRAGLDAVIRSAFDEGGVSATPDALAHLQANLGGDRRMTRSELEKLALFVGKGGTVGLAEAQELVGDSAQRELSDIVLAAGDGAHYAMDRALQRAYREGASAIGILRAASGHFQRLLAARAAVDGGDSVDEAVGRLRPPVFWKEKDAFCAQVSRWGRRPLGIVLTRLIETERMCKRSGMPQEALCNRVLLEIAQAGARRRR